MSEKTSFVVRLSPVLHRRLKRAASKMELSLNEFAVGLLGGNLGPKDGGQFAELVEAIRAEFSSNELEGVVLFGSEAKGSATEESDIDILVVLGRNESINRRLYREWDRAIAERFETRFPRALSPHFVGIPDSLLDAHGLWFEVAVSGIILWDRMGEVQHCLIQLRESMCAGAIQRRFAHGHPYWIRKESSD